MSFFSFLRWDALVAHRYKLLVISVVVMAVYVLVLSVLPESSLENVAVLLAFTDPVFFCGIALASVVMFRERESKTLQALSVTPLRLRDFIWSKVVILSALGGLIALAVGMFVESANVLLLMGAVLLGSVWAVLLGMSMSLWSRSMNELIMYCAVFSTIFSLPMLGYFGIFETWVWYGLPSHATLLLISSAFESLEMWQYGYAICFQLLCIGGLYMVTMRSFENARGRI